MKEIGLGKELGDCSPENVVKFIGCVTTQSKKAILCILSCLLFEINTNIFRCLFVSAKINTRILLKNSLNKFCKFLNSRFCGFHKTSWQPCPC